jgi:hypothetical protein
VPAPAASAEVDAGVRVVPGAVDGGLSVLVKAKGSAKNNDDPYEAATPTAGKTAEPVVPPPPPTVTPGAPSPVPSVKPTAAPSTASSSPQRMFGTEP